MRSCMARCITDGGQYGEAYVQAEKHLCDDCTPDGWVIMNFRAHTYGVDDEACVHLHSRDARRIGKALVQIADELDARG